MKNTFILILLFLLGSSVIKAQTKIDSAGLKKGFDNYYSPFHERIKDQANRTVSKFGHYVSAGLVIGSINKYGTVGGIFSYSFAFRSHLISFTRAISKPFTLDQDPQPNTINYNGILIGESYRLKNYLFSASIGVASSNIYYQYYTPLNGFDVSSFYDKHGIITIPFEIKAFVLTYDGGMGIGFHLSKNFVNEIKYSPFYAGLSVIVGHWNKSKSK